LKDIELYKLAFNTQLYIMLRDPMEVFANPHFFPTPTNTRHPKDTAFPTVVPDPIYNERAGAAGQKALWVVFVLMVLATILFIVLGWALPASKRLFHHVTALITIVAALSYYAMATGSGITHKHHTIREKHDHGIPDTFKHVVREVYWARYADWLITTPLLLIDLGLLAGLNGASLSTAIVADVIMILGGLFAALGRGRGQVWGWFTIAMIAYLVIIYQLVVNGRAFANARGSKVSTFYYSLAGYTLLLWTAYPIVWAIADGTHKVSVNTEIIIYAVLDVLAKGVFGAWLLFTHRSLPESNVEVDGFWAHGFSSEGRIRVGDEDGA